MTDEKYLELYALLEESVRDTGKIDDYILYEIFHGKIEAIIRKAYGEVASDLDITDADDLRSEIYMVLSRTTADKYFNNPSYETGPIRYLRWCKVVTKNYIRSVLRKKSVKMKKLMERVDLEDNPGTWATTNCTALRDMVNKEDLHLVYNTVASLNSKIEMKLVWFGVFNRMYTGYSNDKIRATHSFIDECSDKTLDEIFAKQEAFFRESEYECVRIQENRLLKMKESLDKKDSDGLRRGSQVMSKYLGEDAVGQISDWIYKLNQKLIEIKNKEDMR